MKKFNFTKINITNSGFTLVEALIAISIFTTSIIAILGLISSGISNTNYAKKQVVASYLSQEGIEYVRNMRDTVVLYDSAGSSHGWTNFNNKISGGGCQNSGGCYFDDTLSPGSTNLTSCGTNCPELNFTESSAKYSVSSGGIPSGFVRKITANVISANETKIYSTVYWSQGSGNYSITFSEDLFNWIE